MFSCSSSFRNTTAFEISLEKMPSAIIFSRVETVLYTLIEESLLFLHISYSILLNSSMEISDSSLSKNRLERKYDFSVLLASCVANITWYLI